MIICGDISVILVDPESQEVLILICGDICCSDCCSIASHELRTSEEVEFIPLELRLGIDVQNDACTEFPRKLSLLSSLNQAVDGQQHVELEAISKPALNISQTQ